MPLPRPLAALVAAGLLCGAASLGAQEKSHWSPSLLSAVRRAAALIPGERPSGVNVVSMSEFGMPLATLVEGAAPDSVAVAFPVFQIRFPRGWIMVDAGLDRDSLPTARADARYQRVHAALRDARLVVVTHEHHDHVAGAIHSPHLAAIRQHTLLTRAQVASLLRTPDDPRIRLDSATATRYLVVDYDPFIPIAPGVVLIKAAGHTPGSQMVYLRLASGREMILVGDVAWHGSGIATQRQKPEASTRDFGGEDRPAIADELRWLHELPAEVAVVVSHDGALIARLVARGVLHEGLDLNKR